MGKYIQRLVQSVWIEDGKCREVTIGKRIEGEEKLHMLLTDLNFKFKYANRE